MSVMIYIMSIYLFKELEPTMEAKLFYDWHVRRRNQISGIIIPW